MRHYRGESFGPSPLTVSWAFRKDTPIAATKLSVKAPGRAAASDFP